MATATRHPDRTKVGRARVLCVYVHGCVCVCFPLDPSLPKRGIALPACVLMSTALTAQTRALAARLATHFAALSDRHRRIRETLVRIVGAFPLACKTGYTLFVCVLCVCVCVVCCVCVCVCCVCVCVCVCVCEIALHSRYLASHLRSVRFCLVSPLTTHINSTCQT
jgi:hypothetical protein